jgi:hypothetical protein
MLLPSWWVVIYSPRFFFSCSAIEYSLGTWTNSFSKRLATPLACIHSLVDPFDPCRLQCSNFILCQRFSLTARRCRLSTAWYASQADIFALHHHLHSWPKPNKIVFKRSMVDEDYASGLPDITRFRTLQDTGIRQTSREERCQHHEVPRLATTLHSHYGKASVIASRSYLSVAQSDCTRHNGFSCLCDWKVGAEGRDQLSYSSVRCNHADKVAQKQP